MTIAIERVKAENLFVTPEFRKSEWAREIYGGLDIFVTDDPMFPGHFGTYFGAITRRKYDNPHVQDLYHLHECVHVRTMKPNPKDSFMNWMRRMIASETEASLVSECFAYLHMPGLREKTFSHEIWMDRFKIDGPVLRADNREDLIRMRRMEALHAPKNDDYIEHQIWNYGQQNVQWCRIWADPVGYGSFKAAPAFRVVEEHMADPNHSRSHEMWLNMVSYLSPNNHDENIPFFEQAKAFQSYYDRTNLLYGNHVLVR
jgi:hypothetical protein